jgi:hypothetical protein
MTAEIAVIGDMLSLLTYNPQDTITAADALNHAAFADIRDWERGWRAS